jgi:hypothetical protein
VFSLKQPCESPLRYVMAPLTPGLTSEEEIPRVETTQNVFLPSASEASPPARRWIGSKAKTAIPRTSLFNHQMPNLSQQHVWILAVILTTLLGGTLLVEDFLGPDFLRCPFEQFRSQKTGAFKLRGKIGERRKISLLPKIGSLPDLPNLCPSVAMD